MANISTDIYQINDFVNEIKKNHTESVGEDTLLLGTFGYLGEVFSRSIQNTAIMASEYSNEGIPTRAKYEKNIIAHALGLGISNINAVPAKMDVLLSIVEDDLIKQMTEDTFVFDKDSKIYFGDYEFHPDYDIIIKRVRSYNRYSYTAKYKIDVDNPVSDIVNPYLSPPVRINVNGNNIIYTKVLLRQVEKISIYNKILSSNSIESKTFNFDFDSQLASFTVDVTEGDETIHLVPLYEGLTPNDHKYPYIYYTYLNSNTIRCKFDGIGSYAPRINSNVTINLQTCQGESGNFTWNDEEGYPQFVLDSDKYGYSNLACEVRPISGESMYGSDKKSIAELKRIIPKEALARTSITCLTDLENFFNQIDTDSNKVYLFKKRDNCLERLYYTFLLVKNSYDVIIPSNTINIRIDKSNLSQDNSVKRTLRKGTKVKYTLGSYGSIISDDEIGNLLENEFVYTIPYDITINTKPIYVLYRLSSMNQTKELDFKYINENAAYQFIATKVGWSRPYIGDDGTYTLSIQAEQNVIDDRSMFLDTINFKLSTCRLSCYIVLYDKSSGEPLRWGKAELKSYDKQLNIFYFEFLFKTTDTVDDLNRIRIEGDTIYDLNSHNNSYAYFSSNTDVEIHFVYEDPASNEDALNGLDNIIPDITGILSNTYSPLNGLDFFFNFSEIVNSTATLTRDVDENGVFIEGSDPYYLVNSVPVVKYDYFSTEDKAEDFFDQLIQRKIYIDYALQIIEDNFGIDFKFFNTYGPSEVFTIDNDSRYINRVNISLTFRIKLKANHESNILDNIIRDIKEYIENIQEIANFHVPNLITLITNTYNEDIVFFEFVDMNGFGPGVQHLYNMQPINNDATRVPEFININTLEVLENNVLVYKPDIELIVEE